MLAAGEPPASVGSAIAAMQAMFRGERVDLAAAPVALDALPAFDQAV